MNTGFQSVTRDQPPDPLKRLNYRLAGVGKGRTEDGTEEAEERGGKGEEVKEKNAG